MDKRRIPASLKRRQNKQRLELLASSQVYEKRLMALRAKAIKAALKDAVVNDPSEWAAAAGESLKEPYLQKVLTDLYGKVGKLGNARIATQWGVKQKADKEMWQILYEQWAKQNTGKKIVIISESLKASLIKVVSDEVQRMTDYGYYSIEKMTKELFTNVNKWWSDVKVWQCRRIMQTESMNAMAVASSETVKGLGVECLKTWSCSGLDNTRDIHLAVDGVTVEQDESFLVGGELMMFAHDESLGASAANIINCACDTLYLPK